MSLEYHGVDLTTIPGSFKPEIVHIPAGRGHSNPVYVGAGFQLRNNNVVHLTDVGTIAYSPAHLNQYQRLTYRLESGPITIRDAIPPPPQLDIVIDNVYERQKVIDSLKICAQLAEEATWAVFATNRQSM